MRKIYEAFGEDKKDYIEMLNDSQGFDRVRFAKTMIGINDLAMIGNVDKSLLGKKLNIRWSLNGLQKEEKDNDKIVIIEPLEEQINNKDLANISEVNTYFNKPIKLSNNSIILMSVNQYDELTKDSKMKRFLNKSNVRLYEGEKEFALKMLLLDKDFIYLDIDESGYIFDEKNHPDVIEYNYYIEDIQRQIVERLQKDGRDVTYKNDENIKIDEFNQEINEDEIIEDEIEDENKKVNEEDPNCKMITGLTKEVEGEIELDEETFGATDIGKVRKNQEDALLLIKDKDIPEFRMLVVADGVGGEEFGEYASNTIIKSLKEWFENLSIDEKKCYYNGIEGLKDSLLDRIELKIQPEVEYNTLCAGGSTLVCAIIGKDNTLVANVGDSRAYIEKDGKLIQVSREDTAAQQNLESGKTPTKEASRFDSEANHILQCLGMPRNELIRPNVEIIDNKDYDMLLLFSDGVTDCISDEDIAVVCRTTDKKALARRIVEKALKNDTFIPEEFIDYIHLRAYKPAGWDNATVAIQIKNKDKEDNGEER